MARPFTPTPGLDATRVAPKLYIGGWVAHPELLGPAGIDVHVQVAREIAPHHKGMDLDDDGRTCPSGDYQNAMRAAATVAQALKAGKRVLVTCAAGMNRSAFVAALAMIKHYQYSPEVTIQQIRKMRTPVLTQLAGGHRQALSNQAFVRLLERIQ